MAIRRHFIFSIRTQCESFSGKGRWEDEESVRRWGSWSGWISILLQEIENALHSLFAVKRRLFLICLGVSIGIIVSGDRTKLVKGNGAKKKQKQNTKRKKGQKHANIGPSKRKQNYSLTNSWKRQCSTGRPHSMSKVSSRSSSFSTIGCGGAVALTFASTSASRDMTTRASRKTAIIRRGRKNPTFIFVCWTFQTKDDITSLLMYNYFQHFHNICKEQEDSKGRERKAGFIAPIAEEAGNTTAKY